MSQFVMPAALAGKTVIKAKKLIEDQLGYDFFGLAIKIVVFFSAAWFLEQWLKYNSNRPVSATIAAIFAGLGGAAFFALSQWLIDLITSKEEKSGIKYWDVIKIVATLLVMWEAYNYYNSRESLNMKPSPFTLGVFGVIITVLGLMAVPDLLKKIQELQMVIKK